MFDRILIPVDGSDAAESAAERGFALADAHGAQVTVLSVVEPGPFGSVRLPGESSSAEEAFRDQAAEFVERVLGRAAGYEIEVDGEIRTGVPVSEIVEYAREIGADLVVMGSRGRRGIDRVMLGSVAEGVARHGDVDVLLVKPDEGRAE